MRVGAASLLLERGTPDVLLPASVEYGVTRLFTAPTAYREMLADAGHMPWLRSCVSAGEPMTKHTADAWRELTGAGIVDGIGTTEMLHIFVSSAGHPTPSGAIGKVMAGDQVAVLDEELRPVAPGARQVSWRFAVQPDAGTSPIPDRPRMSETA